MVLHGSSCRSLAAHASFYGHICPPWRHNIADCKLEGSDPKSAYWPGPRRSGPSVSFKHVRMMACLRHCGGQVKWPGNRKIRKETPGLPEAIPVPITVNQRMIINFNQHPMQSTKAWCASPYSLSFNISAGIITTDALLPSAV